MSTSQPATPRTYGGWRRAKGMGLFGLGPGGTVAILAALTVAIITLSVSAASMLVVGPVCAVVVTVTLVQWDGVTLGQALQQRIRWLLGGRRTGWRGGVMATGPHAWQLPGVLAPTELLRVDDGRGGGYGVVYHRRLKTTTVTWRCAAQSTWLADADQAAAWVGNWGSWLAGLGHQQMVRHVAVTVETAPDTGSRLADHVAARLAPDGPPAARRILAQLVEASPQAAADVATWVSVTLHPFSSPARPRTVKQALGEVDRALPGLADGLAGSGVTVLDLATPDELAATVRGAFDPASRAELALLTAAGGEPGDALLGWDNAAPVAATEFRDRYEHDGARSVTWAWHEAPRQPVYHDVLSRLVSPGQHSKRVTLLYRPLPAATAARVVEEQVNVAQFRAQYRRARKLDPRARDIADQEQAVQAAREEALGAGVGRVCLFVTVTVDHNDDADDQLATAVADVEARAEAAKIRLRRLWHSQAAGFATTLPCGICPPVLSRLWPH